MNYDGQVSYAIWLSLPPEARHQLVTLFDIPRSGRTVVEYRSTGAVVTSDGYTAADLQAISLPRMQSLLNSDSDNFYKLFEVVVLNLDALLGGTFVPSAPNQEPAPDERVYHTGVATVVEETIRFCDSCDSKGGRHKKVCPKR